MKRSITGFHRDDESHWVAELSCGHAQHTRHDPPLVEREWVLRAEGRDAKLGTPLDCLRCDRRELPVTHQPARRTKIFTQDSTPQALRAAHVTAPGVWALIHVTHGRLEYCIEAPLDLREILAPAAPGVVLPEVPHHVTPLGPVEFYVEFWRAESART